MTGTGSDAATAVDRAAAWIRDYLATQGGTARAGDVLAEAAEAGHNGRTCRRACAAAGITVTRAGFGKGSTWALPSVADSARSGPRSGQVAVNNINGHADEPAEESPLAMATPPKTWRVPGRRDIYGRVTEYHEVSSPEAASHWDERQWERIGE